MPTPEYALGLRMPRCLYPIRMSRLLVRIDAHILA